MKRSAQDVDAAADDNSDCCSNNRQMSNNQPSLAKQASLVSKIITNNTTMNGNGHHNNIVDDEELQDEQLDIALEQRIAVLDFGAQYGKIIDRRIREHNVLSDILPLSTKASQIIKDGKYKAIIISGGPNSVYLSNAPVFDPEIFNCGLPVLGICYGFQLINKVFGGTVSKEPTREDGQTQIDVRPSASALFDGLSTCERVLLTHGDSVTSQSVAPDFEIIATNRSHVAAISNETRRIYGVQFHPEVDLTENGRKIFDNFLYRIACCSGNYTMRNREELCMEEIRKTVGDKNVLVMVSGGVDSTVCAALLHKALGAHRVTAIHIDNGFMRYGESEQVVKSLNALTPPLDVHLYSSLLEFLHASIPSVSTELCKTVDPELKRRIIGDTFMNVMHVARRELQLLDDVFLAQGTLRPDLIESASTIASGHADAIKTHHNDTALVRELRNMGKVIEPLKDFHKDEVRELGKRLGLPDEIVQRHPFPGPGLAIRILCALKPYVGSDFKTTQNQLTAITNFANSKLYEFVSSGLLSDERNRLVDITTRTIFISTLLPIKTVGVQGDSRSYSYVAAISSDAKPVHWESLFYFARIIPRLLHNINRVVYIFGGAVTRPIVDITPTLLNDVSVGQARIADKASPFYYLLKPSVFQAATDVLFGRNTDGRVVDEPSVSLIQQMPVVLVPLHFDRVVDDDSPSVQRSVCLRPFITNDFMTGLAAVPGKSIPEEIIDRMVSRIITTTPMISRVMIDLTSKPPGTTEWE